MQKVTSSDQKYWSQIKEKILFKLLSYTLKKKKILTIFCGGPRGVIFFFDKSIFFFGIFLPNINGGWL